MKASDYIGTFLKEHGVKWVFEVAGGMLTHMLDSFYRQGDLRIISMHHEQGAGFAAETVGRITGIPGVAMATSGPGATNLVTAIGSCYFDSSPTVFITGQVNRCELKDYRPIRQLGFQETDIVSIALPITKAAWMIETPEKVPEALHQAFTIATSGRPGPVLLDIPMDLQRSDIPVPEDVDTKQTRRINDPVNNEMVEELFEQFHSSERPLILAGGGIHSSKAEKLFRSFVQKVRVPVVNSLMAVDALAYSDPLRVGMIGSYGNRWANLAIGKCDFLLVLGSRLDIRQTGSDTKSFKGDRIIFHVDCEPGEINNRVMGCRAIVSDLQRFLIKALRVAGEQEFKDRRSWLEEINDLKNSWPDTGELSSISGINPNIFMHQLSAVSRQAAAYTVDVGQSQMWAAQSLEIGSDQRFLTSGGMGSMGFALPAAIGAALALSPRPVVVIAGDGGFQLNIQELQTVAQNDLPIKMIVINNRCLGMVRQFQQSYFDSRYQSTLWGYGAPDFARVASAYGISANTVAAETEIEKFLEKLWEDPEKPALLQVMIDTFTNVYPKIAFGKPMTEMEPFAKSIQMEEL
ncbi:Acetolactate synthase large subunit [subsurface metagenome]